MKELIKSFFFTDPINFPQNFIDLFLPDKIQTLYFGYYTVGTGYILLLSFTPLVIFHFLTATKSKIVTPIMSVLTFLLMPNNHSTIIQNTTYAQNILGLPLLNLSPIILFTIYASYLIFLQIYTFRKLRYHLSPKFNLVILGSGFFANLLLILPFFTGELWQ